MIHHLSIKFIVWLTHAKSGYCPAGPLFHRWLPNGKEDAIHFNIEEESASLMLWFERQGYTSDSGLIKFSFRKQEVDTELMQRQALLDAGPLFCQIEMPVSEDEYSAVTTSKIDNSHYIRLGKRIVKNIVHPHVFRVIELLRVRYGQYWLASPEEWDSRRHSLGSYCTLLQMHWSAEEGEEKAEWYPFEPYESDKPYFEMGTLTVVRSTEYPRQYPSEQDWRELSSCVKDLDCPTSSESVAVRAHELAENGLLRQALIEAVTASEIAIEEVFRMRTKDKTILRTLKPYWSMSLPAKLTAVALCVLSADVQTDLAKALEAIEQRNRIVHEGQDPPHSSKELLYSLLRVTRALISDAPPRFPSALGANEIREDWET